MTSSPPFNTRYSRTQLAYLAAIADLTNGFKVKSPHKAVIQPTSSVLVKNLVETYGGEASELFESKNRYFWDVDLPTREYLLRLVLQHKFHLRSTDEYIKLTDGIMETIQAMGETPYPFED